jgi:signal transduction histidine kinase
MTHRPRRADLRGSLRPRHDASRERCGYREHVSAQQGGAPERPPLSTRVPGRAWVRLDWAAAAVCAVVAYAALLPGSRIYGLPLYPRLPGFWIPSLFAVGLALPVVLRRTNPVRAFLLALAGCTLAIVLGGVVTRGLFVPLALVLYTVAASCKRMVAIAALVSSLALLVAEGILLSHYARGSGPAAGVALLLIIAWMIGFIVLQRRSYGARVREQIASAAVTEERLRIARDLHDVVAHSMTVVAVQAGFGEYVFEREPAEARAALGAIQRVTTEALTDMQRLLGVLRQDDNRAPGGGEPRERPLQLAPAPGLADLDRLAATTAGAGVKVEVTGTEECGDLPAAIDQSAFRIVQEALTNVVKHSGAGSCQVTVARTGGDLCVEVTDSGGPGRTAGRANRTGLAGGTGGTGHGIIGMRERVSLCGGEFSAGPLPGQGFRVAARFPLNAAGQ